MTHHHTLITQLCAELDRYHRMLLDDRQVTHPLADRARAALVADGPAVPEGREPAAVMGEPSDEHCWQWYTYCPEEGLEMYSDREQAQSTAQSIMGSYEVAAHSDGWHEDMESVSWGMLVPVEQAQVVERKTAEPGGEFDEWVKYELRPASYAHQPAPAEGEMGELVADLRATARGLESQAYPHTAALITRAADLLEQRHPAPPAEGEVAGLVGDLRDQANYPDWDYISCDGLRRAADLLAQRHPAPVPVSERLPEPNTKVLAHYFNALGKGRTICAIWVPAKSRSDYVGDDDDDFTEYDEEDNKFYWPEGWYEAIENWEELGWVKVYEGEIAYWQPLPQWPAHALPLPAGEYNQGENNV